MKLTALIGMPATGKSYAMRQLLRRAGTAHPEVRLSLSSFKFGTLIGLCDPDRDVYILGDYNLVHPNPGTDRLSMSVQPTAVSFLAMLAKVDEHHDAHVLFEGDRLTTLSFLEEARDMGFAVEIFHLTADEKLRDERIVQRSTKKQKAAWLKGRETKLQNILDAFPDECVTIDSTEAARRLVEHFKA